MGKKLLLLFVSSLFILSCSRNDIIREIRDCGSKVELSEPVLNCDSAILADYHTGTVLYEKNSTEVIPPASMTKLVVNYIVFKEIEKGNVSLDDYVPVDSDSDFRNQPPRSSLMFLEEGQKVTLRECLTGLAIPSGNDAAVAVAKYISGSVENFIERMNNEMMQLGLENTRFEDTSGYSEKNRTTAAEFLVFVASYLDLFPGSISDFHSLESFSYPKSENIGEGRKSARGKIVQYNHNELVGRVAGVDGLKTGYIDESGFNVALSSELDGMRLLGVIMGTRADSPKEARKRGSFDAAVLLSYGFSSFRTVEINPGLPGPVRVWKGSDKYAEIAMPESVKVTVPVRKLDSLMYSFKFIDPLTAPLMKGDIIGSIDIYSGNEIYGSVPVEIASDAERGGFFRVITDEIGLFLRYKIFKKGKPE